MLLFLLLFQHLTIACAFLDYFINKNKFYELCCNFMQKVDIIAVV